MRRRKSPAGSDVWVDTGKIPSSIYGDKARRGLNQAGTARGSTRPASDTSQDQSEVGVQHDHDTVHGQYPKAKTN
jgi:hypothetical protein